MHHCQTFREDLAELILRPAPLDPEEGECLAELKSCESCVQFYQEACAVVRIMDSADTGPPEHPETYWSGFESRLRQTLINKTRPHPTRWPRFRWLTLASGAGAIAAVTLTLFRATQSLVEPNTPLPIVRIEPGQQSGAELDTGTIELLERSELFLRTFVKIDPTDLQDLDDARSRARFQLAVLRERKDAVADFAPVQTVLEDYEFVLREISNVQETSIEDISDIQHRIERRGLIASLKVYQPRPGTLEQ